MAVLAPNLWRSQGHTTFLSKLRSGCRSEASVSPDPTQGQVRPTSTACPSVPAAQPGREQRGEGGLCGPSRSLCLPQAPSPGSSLAQPNPRLSGHSTQRRNSRCGPRERCAEGPKPPWVSLQLVLTATPLGPRHATDRPPVRLGVSAAARESEPSTSQQTTRCCLSPHQVSDRASPSRRPPGTSRAADACAGGGEDGERSVAAECPREILANRHGGPSVRKLKIHGAAHP